MTVSPFNLYLYPFQVTLFLSVMVPFFYMTAKLPLLTMAMALGTLVVVRGQKFPIHKHVIFLFLFYLSIGFFFLTTGHFSPASGRSLPYVATLYVGFPFVYFFVVLIVSNRLALVRVHHTLLFSVTCSSIYTILVLVSASTGGWLPVLDGYHNTYFGRGGTAIATTAISPMVFLLPYLLIGMIVKAIDTNGHTMWHKHSWFYLIFTALMVFIAVIVAGRRVVLLIIATLPIVAAIYGSMLPKNMARQIYKRVFYMIAISTLAVASVGTMLVVFFDFQMAYLLDEFITGLFDPTKRDNAPRIKQAEALIDGWTQAPIFGSGHGTDAGYTRSAKPWRYELSYLSLAFHTGLVGVACYSVGFLWLLWTSFRLLMINPTLGLESLPWIAGLFAMALGYATNPYFDAFDILWTIFFPLAYMNWALRTTAT